MRSSKKDAYDFSDDFEVTYEEDISSRYKVDPGNDSGYLSSADPDTITQPMRRAGQNHNPYDLSIEDPDDGYDGYYDADDYGDDRFYDPDDHGDDRFYDPDDYGDDRFYDPDDYGRDEFYDRPGSAREYGRSRGRREYDRSGNGREYDRRGDYREPAPRSRSRQKRGGQTPIAAPIQKGGRTAYRISRSIVRNLSVILILVITGFLAYNFLRGSAPYGDIESAVISRNYTLILASYFAIAAFFILFELFSALWAMTRVRVHDETGFYKEDVGRGMFSFFFIYICSYGSFWVNNWIPERYEFLRGIKGALDVFGSMHNVLFGLCAAGVISCLFRKYSL